MGHTRRQFIQRGITFVGASMLAPRLAFGRGAARAAADGGTGRIFVIVELEGGNDGLNTLVPFTQAAYYNNRPSLGLKVGQYVQISDTVGLHSGMGALKALYTQNKLAIVQGVGYPSSSRSHFRSTEIWQTAQPDQVGRTGWIGRHLDATAVGVEGIPAIAISSSTPQTLYTERATTAAIGSLDAYNYAGDGAHAGDETNKRSVFLGLNDDLRGEPSTLDFLARTGLTAYSSSQTLRTAAANYTPGATYPTDRYNFGNNLKLIAQTIQAGLGTSVFYTKIGSFDTHSKQLAGHAGLLTALSDGLAAFHQDMEAHGRANDVVVMTFSEFGRRVAENGSGGTDHGTAGPMFVLGGGVTGGLYGEYPSLTTLKDGDLIHTVDFRSVYSTIIRKWLGADPDTILGAPFEDIGFL